MAAFEELDDNEGSRVVARFRQCMAANKPCIIRNVTKAEEWWISSQLAEIRGEACLDGPSTDPVAAVLTLLLSKLSDPGASVPVVECDAADQSYAQVWLTRLSNTPTSLFLSPQERVNTPLKDYIEDMRSSHESTRYLKDWHFVKQVR